MKFKKLLTSLIPKKKKENPLQKLMQAVTPKKKRLPVLKKQLLKKWQKSSLRKTLKAKGKRPMLSFKKRATPKFIPTMLLQRMP